MIYCQLAERIHVPQGVPVTLGSAASILGPDAAASLPIPCPDRQGVWKLDALTAASLLNKAFPGETVSMVGPDVCFIHRDGAPRRDLLRPVRLACAFFILLIGSALGLAWFHSDVDMPDAMLRVCALISGQAPSDPRLVTIPYIIGVALGVSIYYALPFSRAVTPLSIKLEEYKADLEQAEGRELPHE